MSREELWIDWIKNQNKPARGCLGIGDDGALIPAPRGAQYVVVQDAIVEGVDFLSTLLPRWVGRKALAVNLSDLSAMGAEPFSYFVTLGVPKNVKTEYVKALYRGMKPLAKEFGIVCLGGDMSRSRKVWMSITAIGKIEKKHVVRRSGAKDGDWIGVTGSLGGTRAFHHYNFMPRIREGMFLARRGRVNSMMDISDGLSQDLRRLLRASKCGAEIELDDLPPSKDCLKLERFSKRKQRVRMLTDGEDFELLFTVGLARKKVIEQEWKINFPKTQITWIGRISKKWRGIVYQEDGKRVKISLSNQEGYSHFS